ncbi:hypothetical protein [uncultured Ruminococcus sp.]|uniref:hypothetical protein n=1 Tax=uncultured Ruminococcus sp. TaxID=165186 RepID=UPI0025E8D297|nr:hypothetical protein [uncultured Ruminococcus sp.]
MITKDDILKAAEICTMGGDHGELCPNCPLDNEKAACVLIFAEYIKEKEPAPAATGTSSTKKENTFQIDDSTKSDICQVLASAMSTLLALRQEMEPHEKKAFDLGETYKDICCASALMSSVRKGGDGK